MPVITIRLSRKESARVARLAKQRKVTKSRLVRDALAALPDAEPRSAYDDWKHVIGIVEGPPDLSTNPKYMKGFGRWRT